ncbi:UNVERIFIED_CONTAM: hypothetical protein Sradi_7162800 [Sesamum radiatum]|uniref:Copia protein n=1 Tax=Sesamum radiatum TaxID=300843 RepID=A0AAW2IVF7_SESRA
MSRSSAEAEYRSMGVTVCELQWISYLLCDFALTVHTPIPLFCDNKAALHIMANPVFHERTKHLEIDYHIVHNLYKLGFIAPSFVLARSSWQTFLVHISSKFTLWGSVVNTGIHAVWVDAAEENDVFDDAG